MEGLVWWWWRVCTFSGMVELSVLTCSGATYVNIDMLENKKDGNKMLLIEDGNGFKTSTIRRGADVIVFSRCCGKDGISPTQSIGLLSYISEKLWERRICVQ